MGHPLEIENQTDVYIQVIGEEEHLLLTNPFVEIKIRGMIQDQLERRNYRVTGTEEDADYILTVLHSSWEVESTKSEIFNYQSSIAHNYSRTGSGVWAASVVAGQDYSNLSIARSSTKTLSAYRHNLALEISNVEDGVLWTGESTWQTGSVDILNGILVVSQKLISNLPGYGEIVPRVPAIIPEKNHHYYRLYVVDNSFHGPALPNMINSTQMCRISSSLYRMF